MAMNPGLKMLMLDMARRNPESAYRSEYGGNTNRRMIGYDRDYESENRRRMEGNGWEGNRMAYGMDAPESRRRRDSRGRYMEGEGWQGNREYPESRRRRDSRGRYAMNDRRMDSEWDDEEDEDEMRGSQTWYPPHMMGGSGSRYGFGDVYAHINAPGSMNRPEYGGMESNMAAPVDEHTARKWVQKMDGGEHFKIEQTEQQRMAICPDCERWDFYVAMNAMWNDYCETAKKMNIDRPDYYAHLAKDFLKDKDAKPGKLRRYMEHIAA